MYKRVNIKEHITDLSVLTENVAGGKMMPIKSAIIHDGSEFAPLTKFEDIWDVVKGKKCYDIRNLSPSKCTSDRILKTTEKTKFKQIDGLNVNVEGRENG